MEDPTADFDDDFDDDFDPESVLADLANASATRPGPRPRRSLVMSPGSRLGLRPDLHRGGPGGLPMHMTPGLGHGDGIAGGSPGHNAASFFSPAVLASPGQAVRLDRRASAMRSGIVPGVGPLSSPAPGVAWYGSAVRPDRMPSHQGAPPPSAGGVSVLAPLSTMPRSRPGRLSMMGSSDSPLPSSRTRALFGGPGVPTTGSGAAAAAAITAASTVPAPAGAPAPGPPRRDDSTEVFASLLEAVKQANMQEEANRTAKGE